MTPCPYFHLSAGKNLGIRVDPLQDKMNHDKWSFQQCKSIRILEDPHEDIEKPINNIFNNKRRALLCRDWPEWLLKPGGSPTHSCEHQAGLQVRLQENTIQDFFCLVGCMYGIPLSYFLFPFLLTYFPLSKRKVDSLFSSLSERAHCSPVVCSAGHTPLGRVPVELFSHYIPVTENWLRSI